MIKHYVPIVEVMKNYTRSDFSADVSASIIVVALLIPQSLAYALVAGVPPEVGLYASIFPLLVYGLLGSSRTLSVGPVAIISLMTAVALRDVVAQGTSDYLSAAVTLAFMCGLILLCLGVLRFGFIVNFISHSVISGFMTASAILIAVSQIKHLLGIDVVNASLPMMLKSIYEALGSIHCYTALIGAVGLSLLYATKRFGAAFLGYLGVDKAIAPAASKLLPVAIIGISTLAVYALQLNEKSVAIVGLVPALLPSITLPEFSISLCQSLAVPSLLISMIGYVESVSVGKTLAAKRQQAIDPNQELIALGASNIASSLSGAFPVAGGLSRSIVNYDAGAATQAASLFTAVGMACATLLLTPALYYLSKAILAAVIVTSVLSLLDFGIYKKTWAFSRKDFVAAAATLIATLLWGVEIGIIFGIGISLATHLYRTTRPHIAEVGLVEGTEHFRNIERHNVITAPHILSLRLDESLFFGNATCLSEKICQQISKRSHITDVVLMFSAVNYIDYSALEVIESVDAHLQKTGVNLHLSEVKGPVMDQLDKTNFLAHLSGNTYLSQFSAVNALSKNTQCTTELT